MGSASASSMGSSKMTGGSVNAGCCCWADAARAVRGSGGPRVQPDEASVLECTIERLVLGAVVGVLAD